MEEGDGEPGVCESCDLLRIDSSDERAKKQSLDNPTLPSFLRIRKLDDIYKK